MAAVLIAGCGYVGGALASRLAARGERVVAIRRDASALPAGVVPLAADLRDRAALAGVPADVDRLVYAVGPDGSGEDAYRAAYVEGLSNVRDALAAAGASVRRAVLTTSTAVYAQDGGEWVDETSETTARGTAAVLLEGERIVQGSFEQGVALRLAGIYGPGRDRMVRAVAEGSARLPRTPRWTNRIHRDDAASAIERLLDLAAVAPVYVGVDDEPSDLGEVYRWVARALGVAEPPVEAEGERGRGTQKRCKNALLRSTGWAPRYPTYREGYRDALAAYARR